MHKSIKLFIVMACCFTVACNERAADTPRKDGFSDKPVSRVDSLHHDVMEGHDIGMAKIGRLRKYMAQVQQQLDSLNKLPVKQQDKQYQQALITLHQQLQDADKGMNTWMKEYEDDSAKDNETLRIQYLQAEKEKVNAVKVRILQSIHRADSLLLKTR